MRTVLTAFLVIAALGISSLATAEEKTVPDSLAKNHVGQSVAVKGTVAKVSVSGSGTTYLNFGGTFPNQTFTAVIFASDAAAFSNPKQWEGKRVIAKGKVELYKGKPEIVLHKASQLSLAP